MKNKIIVLTLMCIMLTGVATASSINGDYRGNPIVKIRVNGAEVRPEVPGNIVDGSTLLPLRAISESLGANVEWHPDDYSVDVTMPKSDITQEEIDRISKSVARIYVFDANQKSLGQGSGFIIDDGVHGKMLITACHVGCIGANLRVEVNGQTVLLRNQYLFKNDKADVFGVKIDTTAPSIPYVKSLPAKGEAVTEIGFPKAQYQVSTGKVLSVSEIMGTTMITSSVSVNNGFSGGATLNAKGELIGVTVMNDDNNNQSVSLPMSYVQEELNKLQ